MEQHIRSLATVAWAIVLIMIGRETAKQHDPSDAALFWLLAVVVVTFGSLLCGYNDEWQ